MAKRNSTGKPADKKVAGAKVAEVEVKKYRIIGEIFPVDQDGNQQETPLEIDSVGEYPVEVASGWVELGLAEEIEEESSDDENLDQSENKDKKTTGAKVGEKSIKRATDEIVVTGPNGERRVYSPRTNGPKYKTFAEQYAEKIGGEIA